jgi:hypothetical protein
MHSEPIIQIVCDWKQQLVVTASESTIKVSTVNPMREKFLEVKITIPTPSPIRLVSIMENNICAALDDFSINMYLFHISRGGESYRNPKISLW